MTIYLVRHGETQWNVERRLQGRANSPLTERGVEQARAYAELLRDELGDVSDVGLYASPLPRAQQTASILTDVLGLAPAQCSEAELLVERHCGAWEGSRYADLVKRYGESVRENWRRWDYRFGGDGETLADVHARAHAWLAQTRREARTVVVTHGIMSRMFRAAYLGLAPEQVSALESHTQDRYFRLAHGEVHAVKVPGLQAPL